MNTAAYIANRLRTQLQALNVEVSVATSHMIFVHRKGALFTVHLGYEPRRTVVLFDRYIVFRAPLTALTELTTFLKESFK